MSKRVSKTYSEDVDCPCGSEKQYAQCCGLLHQSALAPDAEALMRSRYVAYGRMDEAYLLATWHPVTRPIALDLKAEAVTTAWLGLSIKAHRVTGTDSAVVEFIARYRVGGGSAQRLHEVSRFLREEGRWFYLDGSLPDEPLQQKRKP